MREIPAPLYHYTCDHGAADIVRGPWLRPINPVFGTPSAPVLWLTDLDAPHAGALGLTSTILACDRTAYRFIVVAPRQVYPWIDVRRELPQPAVRLLEESPGAMPRHWYVTAIPQRWEVAP